MAGLFLITLILTTLTGIPPLTANRVYIHNYCLFTVYLWPIPQCPTTFPTAGLERISIPGHTTWSEPFREYNESDEACGVALKLTRMPNPNSTFAQTPGVHLTYWFNPARESPWLTYSLSQTQCAAGGMGLTSCPIAGADKSHTLLTSNWTGYDGGSKGHWRTGKFGGERQSPDPWFRDNRCGAQSCRPSGCSGGVTTCYKNDVDLYLTLCLKDREVWLNQYRELFAARRLQNRTEELPWDENGVVRREGGIPAARKAWAEKGRKKQKDYNFEYGDSATDILAVTHWRLRCWRWMYVELGDSCRSLAGQFEFSRSRFFAVNPHVGDRCEWLVVGQLVCVYAWWEKSED